MFAWGGNILKLKLSSAQSLNKFMTQQCLREFSLPGLQARQAAGLWGCAESRDQLLSGLFRLLLGECLLDWGADDG